MTEIRDINRDEIEIGSIVQIIGGRYNGEYGEIAHFNPVNDVLVYVSLFRGVVPTNNAFKGTVFARRNESFTHHKTPKIRLVSK